jgi:rubrerythrin
MEQGFEPMQSDSFSILPFILAKYRADRYYGGQRNSFSGFWPGREISRRDRRMVQMELSESVKQRILAFQKDEITSAVLYEEIAAMMKNDKNRNVLLEIAQVEREHYATWKHFTGIDIGPSQD